MNAFNKLLNISQLGYLQFLCVIDKLCTFDVQRKLAQLLNQNNSQEVS